MLSSFGTISHAAQQQQEIVELVKGRACTACPTTHMNSGNIIFHQTKKIKGKQVQWPGWNTKMVEVVVQATSQENAYAFRRIQNYDDAEVIRPDKQAAYNHVGIRTRSPSKTQGKKDYVIIQHMYESMNIQTNRSAFWCMKNKSPKIIYIFQIDFLPFNPIMYYDTNLLNRRDNHLFMTNKNEMPRSSHQPIETPSGTIHVLDDDDRDPSEVARELSAQLVTNCKI